MMTKSGNRFSEKIMLHPMPRATIVLSLKRLRSKTSMAGASPAKTKSHTKATLKRHDEGHRHQTAL
jgi:hypothetical protein